MKNFLHDVVQFLFFLIAMMSLGIIFIVYATWVVLTTIYQKITGDI